MASSWWWLRRPDHHGALVAIWLDGRILTVRQSYRANLFLPGGGINWGEDPRDAARRELLEELGLEIPSSELTLAREISICSDYRRDHVRVFELHLHTEPELRIDNREIIAAWFVEPQTLLDEAHISPVIRIYLQYNPTIGTRTR
jgi:8-oxo-dGTP diphosphatase